MDDDVPAEDKPSVHLEGDVAVYRASALYSCHNALLAARLGVTAAAPPQWMQQRFNAGHDHEALIIEKLRFNYGFEPYGFQETVELKVGSKALVRGHVDLLQAGGYFEVTHVADRHGELGKTGSVDVDGLVVADAKALSQTSFERWCKDGWKAFPYYLWQQAAYVHGLEAIGLVMAVKNKNTDDFRVEYYPVESLSVSKADIIQRVMKVEAEAAIGPEMIFARECSPKMFPCPIFFLHPDEEKVTLTDNEVTGGFEVIAELATLHQGAKARAKEAEAEIEQIESRLRTLYGDKVASAKLDDFTVSTYHHGYQGVNWGLIAERAGLESAEEAKTTFTETKESEKLSVKVTPKKKKTERKE